MEDDLKWRTTCDERRPLMEDDLGWKKTTDGRRPSREDDLRGKTTFMEDDLRRPLMEDHLWWKTAFDGRWPLMEDDRLFCKMTFMDDDLWWRVPSKWWWCSICLRSSSFLRLSECLMSYSFLEDDLYGRRPLMEGHLWWFTLLLGVYVVWGYFEIRLLVYLSRGSYSSIFSVETPEAKKWTPLLNEAC